jgi:hypothetical protein
MEKPRMSQGIGKDSTRIRVRPSMSRKFGRAEESAWQRRVRASVKVRASARTKKQLFEALAFEEIVSVL